MAAVGWLVGALALPFARLWYPFEIEFLGGVVGDHVGRILDGEPLYAEPSADFVPLLYTPLFMYLAAGLSLVCGEGLPTLRLVSILASLTTFVLLFVAVRSHTRSRFAALVACGIWAGGYFVVDTWFDCERVDSTMLALALAGWLVLRAGRGLPTAAVAGGVMTVAYFAKQTALPLALAFAAAEAVRTPRRGLVFAGAFGATWWLATGAADAATAGWFSFYTWALPREHEYQWSLLYRFWTGDVPNLLPAALLVVWYLARGPRLVGLRPMLAQATLLAGVLGACLLSRCHQGGAANVLMPVLLLTAGFVGTALALARWCGPRDRCFVHALVVLQFAWFLVDFGTADTTQQVRLREFSRYLPTAADAAAGHRLVHLLREANGDVLVPYHGYLPRLAGKRGGANAMAVHDVRGTGAQAVAEALRRDFFASARNRRAALVVVDEHAPEIWQLLVPGYVAAGRLVPEGDDNTFMPRVGLQTRPVLLFRREE